LKDYDYSQAGAYFVTICTQNKQCLFGDIVEETVRLNPAGQMIEKWWKELETKFPSIETDLSVIMPNHFHGIIVLVAADLRVCQNGRDTHAGVSLPKVVQWFKTMTTNEYIRGVKESKWPPFSRRVWQSNYYDHIIRNEPELNRIRQYIINNPLKWHLDRENPQSENFNIDHEKYFRATYS
jgi:putative transposase